MRRGLWLATYAGACSAVIAFAACGGSDESSSKKSTTDAGPDASSGGSTGGKGGGSGGSGGSSAAGGSGGSAAAAANAGTTGGGTSGAPSDAAADAESGSGCTAPAPASGKYPHTIVSSGENREFFVHVPPGYGGGVPAMVVMVFHGYTETAEQIEQISQMSVSSDAHGFLAVYPQGIATSWNAGACCGTSASVKRADVQFVSDMLDELEKDYCVDQKRVFAAGFSNGGMLSQRLGCELANRIAAIGPVAGPLAIDPCTPSRPVPLIEFHGTSDFIVPYNGGGLSGAKSVSDTIAFWVANNACTDAQPTSVYSNGDSSCVEYQTCAASAAVRLCTVDGGGHQWPGGTSAGPAGKLTQDIDASEQMYAFFAAHPMP